MSLFNEDFEGGSLGVGIQTGGTNFDGFAGTAAVTFDSTVIHSGQSAKIVYANTLRQLRKTVTSGHSWKIRFKFKMTALPDSSAQLCVIRDSVANANVVLLQIQTTGVVRYLKVGTSQATSGAFALAANTIYYFEFEYNGDSGVARIYSADGSTLLSTITVASGLGSVNGDQIGFGSATAITDTFYFDAIAFDPTTQPGYPSSAPSDAAYAWDGSALVACDAYWWDGSTLTAMDPYWWDGSTLV